MSHTTSVSVCFYLGKVIARKTHGQPSGCIFLPNASLPGTFFWFFLDPCLFSFSSLHFQHSTFLSKLELFCASCGLRALRGQPVHHRAQYPVHGMHWSYFLNGAVFYLLYMYQGKKKKKQPCIIKYCKVNGILLSINMYSNTDIGMVRNERQIFFT